MLILKAILSLLLKNRNTSFLASKNVADNKIVVSSVTLLFIIIAMTTMIYNIAQTISKTYDGFDRVTHYTIRVSNLSGEEENYDYIDNNSIIDEKSLNYNIYGNRMQFSTTSKKIVFKVELKANTTNLKLADWNS